MIAKFKARIELDFTRRKAIKSRSSGFSLVELLAATFVASSVIGVASTIILSNRNLYLQDASRTQVNQNIRAALDLVGFDVRQAGERLPDDFPAVVLNETGDPASGPDTLTVYRSLIDPVLDVCADVNAGSATDISIVILPTEPSIQRCLPGPPKQAQMGAWESYRNDNGGLVKAYIYDPVERVGEFFDYDAEDAANYTISRDSGSWINEYPSANEPRVYLLEEKRFFLSSLDPVDCEAPGNILTLVINNDCANQRFGLTSDMDDFQVQICQQIGGACVNTLTYADSADSTLGWTNISAVDVSVTSSKDFAAGRDTSRTVSSRFFPRNILSF